MALEKAADLARTGKLTPDRARKLIESTIADLMEASDEVLPRFSIAEYFRSWLKHKEQEAEPSTFVRYKGIVENFLRELGAGNKRSLPALRVEDVQRYRDKLSDQVSSGTVNTHLKVLRVALEKAVRRQLIDKNPAKLVENLQRTDRHRRRAFTIEELKRLLEAADDDWRTMILFGLYTGLRLQDIACLSWKNVNLQREEIVLETQKTKRVQILPIAKPLLRHIQKLPAGDDPAASLCPGLEGKSSSWLSNQFYDLMSNVGLVPSRDHQTKHKERPKGTGRSKRRDLIDISFHSMRHTATSLLKNAGVSDVIARDIIGHESEAVSRNYTHIESETKRRALDSMPDLEK